MTAIIFANAAVLDGTSGECRENHHVLVEGKHNREVSDRPITSTAASTIDLNGRTLMPGLIDAHVARHRSQPRRFCTRPAFVHGAEMAESRGGTSGCLARRDPRLPRRNCATTF